MRNPFRKERRELLLLVGLLLLVPAFSFNDTGRVKAVGSKLMCICGCGQVLTECNHIHCPSSVPMIKELNAKLDAGMTDQQAVNAFVEKYGTIVMAAPPFKGRFNIFAWSITFLVLLAGGAGVLYYLRRIKASTIVAQASAESTSYNQKIEDELRRYTPED